MIAGFDLVMLLVNAIPVIALSVFLILGLIYIPEMMIKIALLFGKFIVIVITVGLATAGFQQLTGVVLIPGMAPIEDGLIVVGQIGVILLGTFPILTLFVKYMGKPLSFVGRRCGLDATSAAGIVFTLANSIPVYKMIKNMNPKGKVVNIAWLVPATAALGDHLGFTAGVSPDMITPVVLGKIIAGIFAIILALWLCGDLKNEIEQSKKMDKKTVKT